MISMRRISRRLMRALSLRAPAVLVLGEAQLLLEILQILQYALTKRRRRPCPASLGWSSTGLPGVGRRCRARRLERRLLFDGVPSSPYRERSKKIRQGKPNLAAPEHAQVAQQHQLRGRLLVAARFEGFLVLELFSVFGLLQVVELLIGEEVGMERLVCLTRPN